MKIVEKYLWRSVLLPLGLAITTLFVVWLKFDFFDNPRRLGTTVGTTTNATTTNATVVGYDKMPTVEQRKIVGYYPNWGIYQKGFPVTKIRGDRINVINYAFLIPLDRTMPTAWDKIVSTYRGWKYSNYAAYMQQPPGTTLTAGIGLFDEYADAGANSAGEALTMAPAYTPSSNFGQLQALKAKYPKLKTMISIGGWTLSAPLYSISRDAQKRADFAKSSVYVMVKYGFDGIDIDWEYPGGGGLDGSGVATTSDGANYNLLLQAVRDEMNRQTAIDGKKYYLSIAGPGGEGNIANFDPKAVSQIADWINIMTYDFHSGGGFVHRHQCADGEYRSECQSRQLVGSRCDTDLSQRIEWKRWSACGSTRPWRSILWSGLGWSSGWAQRRWSGSSWLRGNFARIGRD